MNAIRIGTRGSALALAQARLVASSLEALTELVVVRTAGDETARPIRELGDGAFVAALEESLRRGDVDVAVHSLKDLPTEAPADLVIAAVPGREDPRDVLVTAARGGLASLPRGALVGTSSPRRAAFLRAVRADVRLAEIRGNVETRMRKVRDGEFDATVLALAGLRRLGVAISPDEILPAEVMLPAPGQGALMVGGGGSHGGGPPGVLDIVMTMLAARGSRPGVRAISWRAWSCASRSVGVASTAVASAPARAPFCTASWIA